jgi:leucyl-tRNA---protein transferase
MSLFRTEGYIHFYRTLPHPCGYLPGRRASNAVVDPELDMEPWLYTRLAEIGFRRSGPRVYRPACPDCNACIPLRIPVAEFSPNRTQRRILARNRDLAVTERAPAFDAGHFDLYCRYLSARHADSDMETMQEEDYLAFLVCDGIETRFLEFRLDGRCVAVAVADVLTNALSAVYTFFDPALARRSLGVCAILQEIETARALGKDWLYLGYWIPECRKMNYKDHYRPHEVFVDGCWRRPDEE